LQKKLLDEIRFLSNLFPNEEQIELKQNLPIVLNSLSYLSNISSWQSRFNEIDSFEEKKRILQTLQNLFQE